MATRQIDKMKETNGMGTPQKYMLPLFFAALLGSFFEGYFNMYPSWLKVLNGLLLYLSLWFIPWGIFKRNYHALSKFSRVLYASLIVFALLAFVRGILSAENLPGNKYFTLLFNPYCLPSFFPLLYLLIFDRNHIAILKQYLLILAGIIMILFVIGIHGDLKIILPLSFLYPILSSKEKLLFYSLVLLCLYCNFIDADLLGGGTRKLLLCIGFAALGYIIVYILKSKVVLFAVLIAITLFPINIINSTIVEDDQSFFQKMQNTIMGGGNKVRSTDTRTFLYQEVGTDLTLNEAWLLGKGLYSTYYSNYFDQQKNADSSDRISVEVVWLHFLLKAGLVFVVFYLLFLQNGIYSTALVSIDKWILYLAFTTNGFCLSGYMGNFVAFDFTIASAYMMMGLLFSCRKGLVKHNTNRRLQ